MTKKIAKPVKLDEYGQPEISLAESIKRTMDNWFTPERKHDAARLLRKMIRTPLKGKEKELALKYAKMLDSEGDNDHRRSEEFKAQMERARQISWSYDD